MGSLRPTARTTSPASSRQSAGDSIPDPDALAKQKQLLEAGIPLTDAPSASPWVAAVCAEAYMGEAVRYKHFNSRDDLLPAAYDVAID